MNDARMNDVCTSHMNSLGKRGNSIPLSGLVMTGEGLMEVPAAWFVGVMIAC